MRIIGCDLHARQQSVAMLDTETGEVVNRTLMHECNEVREFYGELPRPVLLGIEAIGPMQRTAVVDASVDVKSSPSRARIFE